MAVILKAEHICVAYEGKKVVDHVSFEVESGDYLCIVGENGAGKSSLVKAMLGLVPTCCGKAEFLSKNGRARIGYLSQQTQMQSDFPATVRETVLSGCLSGMRFPKFYTKKEKNRAEEYMRYLDIDGLAKKAVRTLSGGQRQRVFLARALCAAEEILALDEPVSGLDSNASKDLYACLEKLNRERGITVIMISHDMHSALRYATKILHLDGKLLFYGTKDAYLLSPYSKMLL